MSEDDQSGSDQHDALLRLIIDGARDTIVVADANGVITFVSPACLALLGYEPGELVGARAVDLVHPEDREKAVTSPRAAFGAIDMISVVRCKRRDGTYVWVESRSHVARAEDGGSGQAVAIVRDVSDRVRSEALLSESESRLRAVLDSAGEGIVVVNERGQFVLFNAAAEHILGLGATDDSPETWTHTYGVFAADRVTPIPTDDLPPMRALRGEHMDGVDLFIRNAALPEGAYISVTARPLQGDGGAITGGVVTFRDVTELNAIRGRLAELVVTDALTGAPNRRAFESRLAELVADGERGRPFALAICDIDRFKTINDEHGHQVGDDALVAFSDVLRRRVRKTDFVARYGGDEFAILLTGVDEGRAARLVEAIRLAVRQITRPLPLTASFGVCGYSTDFRISGLELVRLADAALYRAKAEGRDRVMQFHQDGAG